MPKLIVKQATIDYYGAFASPAFELMGEGGRIMGGLSKALASHNLKLTNFRTEVDIQDPSANGIAVLLGRFGVYRFKFDQVQASLNGFDSSDLEGLISVVQKGEGWLRETIKDFSFRNHIFVYSSHSALSEGTSSTYLLSLPRRNTPVFGEDQGSGLIETWQIPEWDAKIHFSLSHSGVETEGIYIHYMLVYERDTVDFAEIASNGIEMLYRILNGIGLEMSEESQIVL